MSGDLALMLPLPLEPHFASPEGKGHTQPPSVALPVPPPAGLWEILLGNWAKVLTTHGR